MRTTRTMRQRQMTAEERAQNDQRLAEVNGWLGTVDLGIWHVGHATVIDGYLLGVMMTYLADSYTILAQNAQQVRLIEAGWRSGGSEWPSNAEAAVILAAAAQTQAQGGAQ